MERVHCQAVANRSLLIGLLFYNRAAGVVVAEVIFQGNKIDPRSKAGEFDCIAIISRFCLLSADGAAAGIGDTNFSRGGFRIRVLDVYEI